MNEDASRMPNSTEEIDEDFEKIIEDSTRYMTKQEMRIRQLIEQRFIQAEFIATNSNICEIGGDQTKSLNMVVLDEQVRMMVDRLEELQTQLQELQTQFAHIEVESLPEDVQRKFKRIENQLRELRDSGIATAHHPQHVRGHSYDSQEAFDPAKQSSALCNFTYGGEEHGAIMNELKELFYKRGDLERPPVVEVETGPNFDPVKCAEALMINGEITQCSNYKFGKSKYCKKHMKNYEEQ